MISRDTFKQQRLTQLLQEHGHEGGWRAWLREQRQRRLSSAQIGCLIYTLTGMAIDPTTLLLWMKQAAAERRHAEKKATCDGRHATGPGETEKQS